MYVYGKFWYENETHSTIANSYCTETTLFTSKLDVYGLYSHAATYNPQFEDRQGVNYKKKKNEN